jgi:NADH-quinone oxidoreductase subunit E
MSSDTLLSEHVREEIEHWKARFPEDRQRSAVIGALHAAQHDNDGFLTPELMDAVAEYLGLPNIQVYEVATFYSMFQTKPVGRNNVAICTNVSCMLRGADDIVEHVENKLGVKLGESTEDGRIYLKREEECLATRSTTSWTGSTDVLRAESRLFLDARRAELLGAGDI